MFRGILLAALLLTGPVATAWSEQPLHRQIDSLIEQQLGEIQPARLTTDAEFSRRIYLDLAGRIPTASETREFLANKAAHKRRQLIDKLLAGPDYARHMRERFHVMLMERRGNDPEWLKFLDHAFRQNMPWDQLAQAIIHPNADDEALRGAAYFYTARLVSEGAMAPVDVPALTRDTGRLLAGIDLQCAQCHDHLSVDDYLQEDFQGLHMIFENLEKRRDVSFPAVSEKLMVKPQEFMSVFLQEPRTTPLQVPGAGEVEIVVYPEGEEYEIAPDRKKKIVGVPKFSPLTELATGLAAADNPRFSRNMANRLWFLLLGRGLVEPLDLHHSDNPASHPALLDLLTREFVVHDFDMKHMLRELALSDTYQRASISLNEEIPAVDSFAVALEKPLSAEQLYWSTLLATGAIEVPADHQPGAFAELVSESEDLQKLEKLFHKTFDNPPKEPEVEFAPTVKAALFLMHESRVQAMLEPREGSLMYRLEQIDDNSACLEELFLSVLSRKPSEEESAELGEYVDQQEDRTVALQHLAWAMLASTEYCLNH